MILIISDSLFSNSAIQIMTDEKLIMNRLCRLGKTM